LQENEKGSYGEGEECLEDELGALRLGRAGSRKSSVNRVIKAVVWEKPTSPVEAKQNRGGLWNSCG
jgi:hypothetical protein